MPLHVLGRDLADLIEAPLQGLQLERPEEEGGPAAGAEVEGQVNARLSAGNGEEGRLEKRRGICLEHRGQLKVRPDVVVFVPVLLVEPVVVAGRGGADREGIQREGRSGEGGGGGGGREAFEGS
ncbi:hypothetical protein NL676_039791 [Syzygium grande]|nr:hypothetical protein NL676_039791 [Syzygium grande]